MFKQLFNLKKLTLSIDDQMNLDEKVGESFFNGLENIEEIKLFIENANYDVKFIRSTKFVSKMIKLQSFRFHVTMFDLNFNKVCNLDFIKDLSHIFELNLSDNNLSEVKCDVFDGLCNVKILNLVNIIENDIKSILKKKIVKNFTTELCTGVSRLFNEKNSFFKHEITNIYSNYFRRFFDMILFY